MSSVPVAISTGTRISRNRLATPLRCHVSIAAACRFRSSGDNCARAAATISPNSDRTIRRRRLEKAGTTNDAPARLACRMCQ